MTPTALLSSEVLVSVVSDEAVAIVVSTGTTAALEEAESEEEPYEVLMAASALEVDMAP